MRPRTCDCGACPKCKARETARRWYARLTPAERRDRIEARDPAKVRENDRRKQAHRRRHGTPEQRQKYLARKAVWQAVRDGRLVKGPCELAGPDCAGRIEAHHDDYERRFEVRWLCRHHHNVHHAEEARPA